MFAYPIKFWRAVQTDYFSLLLSKVFCVTVAGEAAPLCQFARSLRLSLNLFQIMSTETGIGNKCLNLDCHIVPVSTEKKTPEEINECMTYGYITLKHRCPYDRLR